MTDNRILVASTASGTKISSSKRYGESTEPANAVAISTRRRAQNRRASGIASVASIPSGGFFLGATTVLLAILLVAVSAIVSPRQLELSAAERTELLCLFPEDQFLFYENEGSRLPSTVELASLPIRTERERVAMALPATPSGYWLWALNRDGKRINGTIRLALVGNSVEGVGRDECLFRVKGSLLRTSSNPGKLRLIRTNFDSKGKPFGCPTVYNGLIDGVHPDGPFYMHLTGLEGPNAAWEMALIQPQRQVDKVAGKINLEVRDHSVPAWMTRSLPVLFTHSGSVC